jgi:hypothetical protein
MIFSSMGDSKTLSLLLLLLVIFDMVIVYAKSSTTLQPVSLATFIFRSLFRASRE